MKAFFVGLIFVVAVGVCAGIGLLLYPLVIVLNVLLQVALAVFFICFCIWLLGKLILFIFGSFKKHKQNEP